MADNKFACLTYHLVGEWPTQYAVGKEQLRAHLSLLNSDGYTVEGFRIRTPVTIRERRPTSLHCVVH